MPTEKKPKSPKSSTKRRADMSAMEPAADLVRTMFKQADRKLAEKLEAEQNQEEQKNE